LKVSANVKIAMQCFEKFEGGKFPPWLRACFIPCLPFRVHVAGGPNQKLPFIASVLSTSFSRALEQMEISMSPNDVFDLESPLN